MRVNKVGDDECWEWTGPVNSSGYGGITVNGRVIGVHVFSFILATGKDTSGMDVDHLCRNHRCCNPRHLELVTHRENGYRGKRGILYLKCVHGHDMTPDNIALS